MVPTARVHESWPASDDVFIRCNKTGSTNADIFADFLEKAFARKARRRIPQAKQIVLCLDSGGGGWLRLSPEMTAVCLKYNLRPWFLPPWTTKALMALHQSSHSSMAAQWSSFKKEWAQKQMVLTSHLAVKAICEIAQDCLSPKLAPASWRHIGFTPGEIFNGNTLFVDRKHEFFKSVKDLQSKGSVTPSTSFKFLRKISPPKSCCGSCNQ